MMHEVHREAIPARAHWSRILHKGQTLRISDTEVVAFSQKCTHLGCVVYYEADEHRWHCPCHEGNFDAETGDVISGPPLRPLGRIDVETRDDGMIWALGRSQET